MQCLELDNEITVETKSRLQGLQYYDKWVTASTATQGIRETSDIIVC